MDDEMNVLIKTNTWELAIPVDRKHISSKLVFKIKYKAHESRERYKARLAVKRYSQRECIDFYEMFSPIGKFLTIHCVISIVLSNGWAIFQLVWTMFFACGFDWKCLYGSA